MVACNVPEKSPKKPQTITHRPPRKIIVSEKTGYTYIHRAPSVPFDSPLGDETDPTEDLRNGRNRSALRYCLNLYFAGALRGAINTSAARSDSAIGYSLAPALVTDFDLGDVLLALKHYDRSLWMLIVDVYGNHKTIEHIEQEQRRDHRNVKRALFTALDWMLPRVFQS